MCDQSGLRFGLSEASLVSTLVYRYINRAASSTCTSPCCAACDDASNAGGFLVLGQAMCEGGAENQ